MNKKGWVKLYRDFLDWEYYPDSNTSRVFMHLLLKATHEPIERSGIILDAGEYACSVSKLSESLRLTTRQTRTAINNLLKSNTIAIRTTNRFSVFSIQNWEKYQSIDKQNDKQNDKKTANQLDKNDKPRDNPNNNKNIKNNINNNILQHSPTCFYDGLSEDENLYFSKFLENWKWTFGNGKSMGEYAIEWQLMKVLQLPKEIRLEAIKTAIAQSWKNIHDIRRTVSGGIKNLATIKNKSNDCWNENMSAAETQDFILSQIDAIKTDL